MKRTVVLVNPAAGGGRAGRVWQRLCSEIPEIREATLIRATAAEAGRVMVEDHLSRGVERIVAVGGDGTAHLVANVLLESGHGDVPFGLVPAGTGSDLARGLGLPRDPVAALRRVLAAEPRVIDAMRIRTEGGERRFAANTISAGMSGAVVPAINAKAKRGRLSYLATTLSALLRYRAVPCRVEVDGEPFCDGRFFLVALANGRYFGNGMPVAPEADLGDGLIDVVFIPPVPLWHLPIRMPQFLSGRHVELPFVRCRRGETVRLEPTPGFPPYEVDGECLPAGPAEVRVLPAALRVLA